MSLRRKSGSHFQAIFHTDPESRESIREKEKKRVQTSNRLTQVENEIKGLCEKFLPFSLAGGLFDGIKQQIEKERESTQGEAIKAHAAELAKRIVRVVEEPEPIYQETLTPEKMKEFETRIYRLLKEGVALEDAPRTLNLSERDAARLLCVFGKIKFICCRREPLKCTSVSPIRVD